MRHVSLSVRPGTPDVPRFIDVDCSGCIPGRRVELLINGVSRRVVVVDGEGRISTTYTVPNGLKVDLADFTSCSSTAVDITRDSTFLCGCSNGMGDSFKLVYEA